MKLKKKHIIIASLCSVGILGLIGCLYAFGFRITYAPKLENSWDAISAFASWAGVVVSVVGVGISGLAIYYAVQVPEKIADRQDRIALFEKRMTCFMAILKLLDISDRLDQVETTDALIKKFRVGIGNLETAPTDDSPAFSSFLALIQIESKVLEGEFLFSEYDSDLLRIAIFEGRELMSSAISTDTNEDRLLTEDETALVKDFCKKCTEFKEKYLNKIVRELTLNKDERRKSQSCHSPKIPLSRQ